MDQEHQTGFAQIPGDGETFGRPPAGVVEGLFQIDLGAGAGKAGDTPLFDFSHDAVAIPGWLQVFSLDENVAFVGSVADVIRNGRHTQAGQNRAPSLFLSTSVGSAVTIILSQSVGHTFTLNYP